MSLDEEIESGGWFRTLWKNLWSENWKSEQMRPRSNIVLTELEDQRGKEAQ